MKLSSLRKPKVLISLVLLIAIVGFVAKKLLSPPPAPAYLTAIAERADLQDTVLASGVIKAFKQISVGAQVTGQIKSLKVALGDRVKKGQLVAEIDSMTQTNTLRTAEYTLSNRRAQLRSKQSTLKQAQLAYDRQKQMLAGDASSREAFETAEATLNTTKADIVGLEAQIESDKIAVNNAQVNLGYTKISSPIDGQVVAIVAQEGQTVTALQTTPTIIKVAQMDTVTVKAQISEADVVRVKPGQQVFFSILGDPDKRYTTTLRAIEPAPDSILVDDTTSSTTSTSTTSTAIYYNGLLDVPNPEGKLRISMTTQVNIVLNEAKNAIVIPSTALGDKDKDGKYTVRVMDDKGNVSEHKVTTGINTNARVEITSGLKGGEKVITGTGGAKATTDSEPQHRGPPPM